MRGSLVYRRIWYYKKYNTKKIHILSRVIIVAIILTCLFSYANRNLMPYIEATSGNRALSLVTKAVNEAVCQVVADTGKYKGFTRVIRDGNRGINLIETDAILLNEFRGEIVKSIDERLVLMGNETISVPLGSLTGNSIFSGFGPDIYIKFRPQGRASVTLESKSVAMGMNQTKHGIYLNIRIYVSVVAPFLRTSSYTNLIVPVAETIIAGDIPETHILERE